MTLLVFYEVLNELDWQRDEFDADIDEFAFKRLWENRKKVGARFFDMNRRWHEPELAALAGDEIEGCYWFEDAFNDEEFDYGDWWCKCLQVPDDIVKQIIQESK